MRPAVMGLLAVGALMSLVVRLAWAQAKDLDMAFTIWPTREGTIP
jgi:hypothetical protein